MQSPWTSSSCSAWKSCISAGDEVYLCDITDIADGAAATIKIVEKDADGKDDPVTTLSAVVSGGRIKCQWQVKYTTVEDDADSQQELAEKGYTLPEYAFVVECGGATSGESGVLEDGGVSEGGAPRSSCCLAGVMHSKVTGLFHLKVTGLVF